MNEFSNIILISFLYSYKKKSDYHLLLLDYAYIYSMQKNNEIIQIKFEQF